VLRVAEQAYRTDTGRQRTANEDSYFVRAPVFAVADGMGGAKAGEVASRIAADAFDTEMDENASPESRLRRVVESANRQIHQLAERDTSRAGMGTTLTAAMLGDGEISVAHVGDSRAYVYREGRLRQLTRDHSLVEELRRQGRLTDREAEEHPQRSIITRALGPEAEVEVDTMTYPVRSGDVFLLCSDGLTTMVDERRIATILQRSPDLQAAADALVDAANRAGGRDNVTVVAFRLEETEAPVAEHATLVGPAAEEAGLTADAVREGLERERVSAARAGRVSPPPRRWPRRLAKTAIGAAILAAVVVGAVYGVRHVYFLGTDDGGRVALYRGLPYDLPFGVHLYDERYASIMQTNSLPTHRRHTVTDHELRSRADAISALRNIERQQGAEP
jgi:PPM family protein phosphatase